MSPLFRITEQYSNYLVPVPSAGSGVCATCWSCAEGGPRCYPCRTHLDQYGGLLADVVVPVALALDCEQFADELRKYKNSPAPAIRNRLQRNLSAVLAQFLHEHERCLESAVRVPGFDLVITVPSTRERPQHPLTSMVGRQIGRTSARFGTPLTAAAGQPDDRVVTPERFHCATDLTDRRVLLIDDTWTTGARIQSASIRLKQAGATHVAALVLGRWLRSEYRLTQPFLTRVREQPFDWNNCCLGRSGHGRCT